MEQPARRAEGRRVRGERDERAQSGRGREHWHGGVYLALEEFGETARAVQSDAVCDHVE